METTRGELTDFCLVLVPNDEAMARAGEAVRGRFTFLDEETRTELVSSVTAEVERLVKRGSGRTITVAISLESDTIHAQITDESSAESPAGQFEIALD
jgi:hypothetical protein